MKIRIDYSASRAVLSLDDGEVLQEHVLDKCVRYVASDVANIWNVDLEITPATANNNIDLLRKLGFLQAGSSSTARQIVVIWRRALRRSGDGGDQRLIDPNLAVPGPVLAPSNEEQRAVRELFAKNGWAL
jgi:hypothetical protein